MAPTPPFTTALKNVMATEAQQQAAEMVASLWPAIHCAGGPRPDSQQHYYFPDVYDPGWLATLPLPIDEARPLDQPVSLLEGGVRAFEQHTGSSALQAAYDEHPRTRVYTDIGHMRPEAWFAIAAWHLGRLAHSELAVICSVYQSISGDETIGLHEDRWYGANVQMSGTKRWTLGGEHEVLLATPGSILLLPNGLLHNVSTPTEPGHSVHMTFAICRDHNAEE